MILKEKAKDILTETQINKLKSLRPYSPLELYKDVQADFRLLRADRKLSKNNERIRVGFIVQMPEIWDKESPVYDAMIEDSSFEADLIVVPAYDQITNRVATSYENNYFIKKYPYAIDAYKNGEWISLKKRSYDYLFLQRPYDQYLPEAYRSYNISKYSKVCYIPYGFSGSDVFNGGNTNKSFFRNIYFSFLESDHMVNLLKKQFALPVEQKIHKIVNLGYPALTPYFSMKKKPHDNNRLLWTPRWSYAPNIGGSNFLAVKDVFLEMAKANKDDIFTFRPHPLMFGELQRKGLMSMDEVETFLKELESTGINYDTGAPIVDAFCDADILITDYSSIIIQFFITGKPIIYCDGGIELNSLFKRMSEGFYIAGNEKDVIEYVDQLMSGNDPLYEVRQKIIKNELRNHANSTKAIVDMIRQDAFYNRKCKL